MFSVFCRRIATVIIVASGVACEKAPSPAVPESIPALTVQGPDPHSYSRPDLARINHLDLDIVADFETQRLEGSATLSIERLDAADALILDTNGLDIRSITLLPSDTPAAYALADADPVLGRELFIAIRPMTRQVRIEYASSPDAPALQWLSPAQTTSGSPFLFSQSQAILARSWVPLQDSPGVRFTYDAKVTVPVGLMALMSASNVTEKSADGVYEFTMPQPIPSYLMAIAVGDLEFRSLGPRSGVYAEPAVIEAAAWEFAEVEAMLDAGEDLYGPYLWDRYDLLVLPPSFPYGGMENPRLTYVTPTLLAGDRSLVNVVAHEIAHSWSGNLVTNSTWQDFWLNEGFTTYVELRIMEAVRGADYAEMLWSLSLTDLRTEFERHGENREKTHLYLENASENPDDDLNTVAYDKGAALLRRLEHYVGRERWDEFLVGYFEHYAFQPIDTPTFIAYLQDNLLDGEFDGEPPSLDAWIYGPGLPEDYVRPESDAFAVVEDGLAAWLDGGPASELPAAAWTTQEWLHFLTSLPAALSDAQLAELDAAFGLTGNGNAEIAAAWYKVAIRNEYEPAYGALEEFLVAVGRRKFLQPLYTELAKTESGRQFAARVYAEARPGYHSVSANTIDRILDWEA